MSTPDLTADELGAAKAFGITPEEYAAFKSPTPKLPPPARDQRQREHHERLKAAIHEALDERDA